jgi:hypothetical protein
MNDTATLHRGTCNPQAAYNPPSLTSEEKCLAKIIGVISAIAIGKIAAIGAFFLIPILITGIGLGAWLGVTVLTTAVCAVGAYFLAKKVAESILKLLYKKESDLSTQTNKTASNIHSNPQNYSKPQTPGNISSPQNNSYSPAPMQPFAPNSLQPNLPTFSAKIAYFSNELAVLKQTFCISDNIDRKALDIYNSIKQKVLSAFENNQITEQENKVILLGLNQMIQSMIDSKSSDIKTFLLFVGKFEEVFYTLKTASAQFAIKDTQATIYKNFIECFSQFDSQLTVFKNDLERISSDFKKKGLLQQEYNNPVLQDIYNQFATLIDIMSQEEQPLITAVDKLIQLTKRIKDATEAESRSLAI